MDLIADLKTAQIEGSQISPQKVSEAQSYQRKAQFLLDFVEAENSTGFHAPQEASRLLGNSIDYSRKGQNILH